MRAKITSAFAAILICTCFSCGLTDPRYVDYAEEAKATSSPTPAPTDAPLDACNTAALAAFSSNVDPILAANCVSCHATKTFKLQSSAASANRAMVRSWSGWDTPKTAQKIVTFVTGPSHAGSSSASAFTTTKIQAWLDEDNKCSS